MPKDTTHKCIRQINTALAAHNTQLNLIFQVVGPQAGKPFIQIATIKVGDKKRGKPKMVVATFCPFCGEKL
jgi:hypothetical protein